MRVADLLAAALIIVPVLASCGSHGGSSTSSGASGGGSSATGGSSAGQCPVPGGGSPPSCAGLECIATRDCCQGFYCDCINGDTCETTAHCTRTPACAILGASCATAADCCEPDGASCQTIGGAAGCCIDPAKQATHASTLRCYCSADCCPGSTCDVSTGMCQ